MRGDEYTKMWVESNGGPLVAVPQQDLSLWRSAPEDPDADDSSGWGDYGRACEVGDYLGILPLAHSEALVFGEVPDPTTFLQERSVFVRWEGANSEAALLGSVDAALSMASWQSEVRWNVPGPVVLFDSAYPGADVFAHLADEHLVIDLAPGCYSVRHASVEPDDDTMIGLVQLDLLSGRPTEPPGREGP
ncbi:Imm21 family immunity protein [Spirillospora sp. NPDC047418]